MTLTDELISTVAGGDDHAPGVDVAAELATLGVDEALAAMIG